MAQPFLNPASFAPKTPEFTGALGGILRMDQQNQFNQLMNDQLFLQKLGKEEAGIDLEEKKKDLPLKDLRRTNETISLQAKQPYLARLEQTGAEDTLLDREQKARMRPIDYKRAVMGLKKDEQDMDWNKVTREAQLVLDLLPRAAQLGPQEGAKWLKEQRKRYKDIGYDLPDELDNPQAWQPLMKGLENSIPHMRAMALAAQNDAASIEIARMREAGENARHNARLAKEGERDRYSGANAIPTAIRIRNDPKASPERRQEAEQILSYYTNEKATEAARKSTDSWRQSIDGLRATPQQAEEYFSNAYGMYVNQARAQVGLPPVQRPASPRGAGGQVRPPGQVPTQPATSQDGWGIRQLP